MNMERYYELLALFVDMDDDRMFMGTKEEQDEFDELNQEFYLRKKGSD